MPNAEVIGAWGGDQGPNLLIVAGTSGQLWILNGQTWVNQGLTLLPTTGRWRFDMYGTDLIAVDGVNPPQVKTLASPVFAPLGGNPPVSSIVQATDYSLFLIIPNTNQYIFTLSDTIWTPNIATETVAGALDSSPGIITAAHKLRSGIALYKHRAIHFGYFGDPPFFWDFRKVSEEVGAPGQEAIANLGDIHYWPGNDDFYSFDGYSLNRVPNQLKETFFQNLDQRFDYKIAARWDQNKSLVFWHFPSIRAQPPGSLDEWLCLNIRNGKWSHGFEKIDMPLFSVVPIGQVTYDSFTKNYPLYSSVDGLRYGDIQSSVLDQSGVFLSIDHDLYFYIGIPGKSMFTTHAYGDRHSIYQATRFRPAYTIYPEKGAQLTVLREYVPGKNGLFAYNTGLKKSITESGWFNFVNSDRLQLFQVDNNSEIEVTGWEAMINYVGER